ncbi:MAG: hypothetical protein J0G96_04315 [Flavobacteriia bacterium]|nr:hypothetical protein [Flavobacteriia bacterium]OJX36995.1 MAG: hypothetical protein BGO87_14545 [Flavobacteriia bacterium 40-80]
MRRKLFLSFFIIFVCFSYKAQIKVQPEIGFSGTAAAFGFYNPDKVHDFSPYESHSKMYGSENGYVGLNANAGSRFLLKNMSIFIYAHYQWLRARTYSKYFDETAILASNLLGIGTGVRFFEKSKIRLFFNAQILSEVYSEYKDKYLSIRNYRPSISFHVDPGAPAYEKSLKRNIYKGTPLISDFLVGCNVKIVDELSLNFSVGYGIRVLKSQYAYLHFNTDISTTVPVATQYIDKPYNVVFHMVDFQLGLSYAFSFKKKEKQVK